MQWIHPLRCAAAALVLSASLVGASAYAQMTSEEAAQPASATDKPSADDLLKQIDSTKPPKLDESRKEDNAYIEEHVAASRKAIKQKADLCAQFVEMYPDHPRPTPRGCCAGGCSVASASRTSSRARPRRIS